MQQLRLGLGGFLTMQGGRGEFHLQLTHHEGGIEAALQLGKQGWNQRQGWRGNLSIEPKPYKPLS
jgi:hypothetical protein